MTTPRSWDSANLCTHAAKSARKTQAHPSISHEKASPAADPAIRGALKQSKDPDAHSGLTPPQKAMRAGHVPTLVSAMRSIDFGNSNPACKSNSEVMSTLPPHLPRTRSLHTVAVVEGAVTLDHPTKRGERQTRRECTHRVTNNHPNLHGRYLQRRGRPNKVTSERNAHRATTRRTHLHRRWQSRNGWVMSKGSHGTPTALSHKETETKNASATRSSIYWKEGTLGSSPKATALEAQPKSPSYGSTRETLSVSGPTAPKDTEGCASSSNRVFSPSSTGSPPLPSSKKAGSSKCPCPSTQERP